MTSGRAIKNAASFLGLALAVAGLTFLFLTRHLIGSHPALIAIQVLAVLLMVWARVTFGRRSFHAAASVSVGDLVTTGPYRYLRHPIYSSILYFVWAGQVRLPSLLSLGAATVVTFGLVLRMLLEEQFLRAAYPEYDAYSKRVKRVIPFLF